MHESTQTFVSHDVVVSHAGLNRSAGTQSELFDATDGPAATTENPGPLPRSDSVQTLVSLLHAPANPTPPEAPSVRGIDGAGRAHKARITPELEHLTLSGLGLRTVCLSPLLLYPQPAMLREVSLAANALTSIDLAPLGSCKELTVLTLNSNRIKIIDLTPLKNCVKLERLWLHENMLVNLDLAPLAFCTALRSLYLEDNFMNDQSLDISPLRHAKHLRSLRLTGNELAGSLDVTSLLEVPALSQFQVSSGVKLHATGDSRQARVSPALRRCVLDITFNRSGQGDFQSKSQTPTSSSSPSASVSSPVLRRSTPPCFSPPIRGSLTAPRAPRCGSPSPLQSSVTGASPMKRPASRPNPSLVVNALLVGFRRLSRYNVEDSLSRCGKICIRAIETDAALHDPSTILESHVVVVQTPSEKTLRQILLVASETCPVVVFGSERYRANNRDMLSSVLKDLDSSFVADPLNDVSAQSLFARGTLFARKKSSLPLSLPYTASSTAPNATKAFVQEQKAPAPCVSPPRVETCSTLSPSSPPQASSDSDDEAEEACEARREGASDSTTPGTVPRIGVGHRPFLKDLSITLELEENPPLSMWTQISDRLRSGRLSAQERARYRLAGSPRLSPSISSPTNVLDKLQCPELKRHGSNKLRAERAAIELAFHDLGDSASSDCFAGISRTCGLPKCAGLLLFSAALESARAVESTTPESGVPQKDVEGDLRVNPGKNISSRTFLPYWEARLKPYDSDSRLFNVIMDASVSVHNSGPRVFHQARSENLEKLIESASPADSLPHKSKSLGYCSRRRLRRDGWVNSRGCDSGVEHLIAGFMQGRSTRFGMFSLVKMPEAVALGTALVLLALQGESKSRVGGCARTVSAKEICGGGLNASLIAAEAGVFEGVASCLSMDNLRNIKGNYAAEAAPEAIVTSEGCALDYNLTETEFERYNSQRSLLLHRGVQSVFSVHCGGRKIMNFSQFAVFHTVSQNLTTNAAADYFFSVIDFDQDEFWCLADLHHFHVEKERFLARDGIAMSGLQEIWVCLLDMIQPADIVTGVSRNEFLRLTPNERKIAVESILFMEDNHATLNIRKTMKMEGTDPVMV